MNPQKLSLAIAVALNTPLALAADMGHQDTRIFDRVVVSATQTDEKLEQIDSTVTLIEATDIQRNLSDSVQDLFKYEPSISASGGRQGERTINIRGIDGNRVLISVDGVRQAKNLSWGSTSSSRNLIDINTLKQVEVVPGPGSSLYGSDALGGTVYYVTKEPDDLLKKDKNTGGALRSYYDDSNAAFSNTLSFAGKQDDAAAMLIYTHRSREEVRTPGSIGGTGPTRELADPRDGQDNSLLAKVNLDLTDNQQLKFAAEYASAKDAIDDLSSSYSNATYQDNAKRYRLGAQYLITADSPLFDDITLRTDWQETLTRQRQSYFNPMFGGQYTYKGRYDETVTSLGAEFTKALQTGSVAHTLQYGLDMEKVRFAQYRTSSLSGTNRSMPVSDSKTLALFVQDQMSFADDRLRVTPGLRYDTYKITPKPDAAYLASKPSDPAPDANEDSAVSLSLGTTYAINQQTTLFAQYAQGFKAPDMDQMFANYGRQGAYNFIANPDLEPETSNSIELGIRFDTPATSLEALVFYNDYDNFIEKVALPHDANYPYGVFQQQNLSDVTIKGAELKGALYLGELARALTGFELKGALAYADGEYTSKGETQPLDSVSPLSATLGLRYSASNGRWGSELSMIAAKGKDSRDVSTKNPLLPAGYAVFDLTAFYQITPDLRIDAGIFNLADKEYWVWDNVRALQADQKGLARFAEAERHARIGINWVF